MDSRDRAAVGRDDGNASDGANDARDPSSQVSGVAQRTSQKRSTDGQRNEPESGGTWLTRELTPGTIINSKYRVEAMLGRGAMGVVVACEHLELRERVALKFLLKTGYAGSDDFAARFLQEAQVCAKLKNQHITRVVDVGTWGDDAAFMVMEHLDGHDLRRVMRLDGRVPVDRAVNYIVQLCQGLAEAHARGIVHRDLKPSNIFVVRNVDGSDLIKILDFGISKLTSMDGKLEGAGDRTETGFVLGSPKYMSPEQLFESAAVGPYSDVWALGIILYEMLMGRPPFEAPTIAQAIAWLSSEKMPPSICAERADVTPALEAAIFRCFARTIAKRTPNVAVLAGELLEAIEAPNADSMFAMLESILDSATTRDPKITIVGGDDSEGRSSRGRRTYSSQGRVRARRNRKAVVFGVGAAILLAFAGVWTVRHNAAIAAKHAAPAPSVHILVTATPPEATIEIDGQVRGAGPLAFDVASDARAHVVRVSARGYAPEQRTVQFARDIQLDVSLERVPVVTATAAPVAPAAAAPVPGAPATRAAVVAPRIVATPKQSAAQSASESSCSPPYYFSNGIKTFKPECL